MIEVINHQKKRKLRRGFRRALKEFLEGILKEEGASGDYSVILVDSKYIRGLNREFLSRDEETDVISFPLDGVGEIYVNVELAENEEDIVLFALHGLLHLIGYDHLNPLLEGKMREKEEEYMNLWKKSSS